MPVNLRSHNHAGGVEASGVHGWPLRHRGSDSATSWLDAEVNIDMQHRSGVLQQLWIFDAMNDNLLDQKNHFAFGKNWQDYAQKIDESRIASAISDLRRLSGRERLDGLSFLDIGCGSGLHAVAALRLGARLVVGTDIDAHSVAASIATVSQFAPNAPCTLKVCSVFDMNPKDLGTFDIVYSWGVLHHTGDMERAIACSAALVSPDGEFLVALYRKTPFCGMWRIIKRSYSRANSARQQSVRNLYIRLFSAAYKLSGRSFNDYVKNYGTHRGMDFYINVHDWLGGYPYESIAPDICRVMFARLGFRIEREFLTRLKFPPGLFGSGCDEYAFRRVSAS